MVVVDFGSNTMAITKVISQILASQDPAVTQIIEHILAIMIVEYTALKESSPMVE